MNNKKHIEDILYYFEKYHYENMILDDNEAKFIHDYIINLQSKIDKANNKLEYLMCDAQFDNCHAIVKLNEVKKILEEDK